MAKKISIEFSKYGCDERDFYDGLNQQNIFSLYGCTRHRELRSRVMGSIPGHTRSFQFEISKNNNKVYPSQGINSNLY